MRIMMLLWRIWLVQNEVVHGKQAQHVDASCRFLCSYIDSITMIKYHPQADHIKGKAPATSPLPGRRVVERESATPAPRRWSPPLAGWVKLNIDGSYHPEPRTDGVGMVLRDDNGGIVFSSAATFLPALPC
jgi:hypothetical protein